MESGSLTINSEHTLKLTPVQHSGITFHAIDTQAELVRIAPDGFYVRGEKLDQNSSEARNLFDGLQTWLEQARSPFQIGPTGIEKEVCEDIARRQALGVAKYGTTVANNPLELKQWLVHQYEELLDAAVYLKRAIAEIDKNATVQA